MFAPLVRKRCPNLECAEALPEFCVCFRKLPALRIGYYHPTASGCNGTPGDSVEQRYVAIFVMHFLYYHIFYFIC
jgi:hypothetical protein